MIARDVVLVAVARVLLVLQSDGLRSSFLRPYYLRKKYQRQSRRGSRGLSNGTKHGAGRGLWAEELREKPLSRRSLQDTIKELENQLYSRIAGLNRYGDFGNR